MSTEIKLKVITRIISKRKNKKMYRVGTNNMYPTQRIPLHQKKILERGIRLVQLLDFNIAKLNENQLDDFSFEGKNRQVLLHALEHLKTQSEKPLAGPESG